MTPRWTVGLAGRSLLVVIDGDTAWPPDLAAYRTLAAPAPNRRLDVVAQPGWLNPRLTPPPTQSEAPAAAGPVGSDRDPHGGTRGARAGSTERIDRWDLAFEAGPDGDRAWTDGSPHALEAAVQLSLCRLLLAEGGLLIHAAAGVDAHGGAWLIPGPSGAGKSTAARAAGFARVLSDELPIVAPGAGGWQVWPSPFWSSGRSAPLQFEPAPLAVLARPIKAPAPAVGPLDRAEAAAWLMSCVAWYEDAPAERARAFELACDVAAAAPRCVALAFPKEGPWLSAVQSPS